MPRTSEEFGVEVRRVLGQRGWSYRRATVATGIDHGTIGVMAIGIVPKRGVVIDWAQALKEPINRWLELAQYPTIPESLVCEPRVEYRFTEDLRIHKTHGQLTEQDLRTLRDQLTDEAIQRVVEEANREEERQLTEE